VLTDICLSVAHESVLRSVHLSAYLTAADSSEICMFNSLCMSNVISFACLSVVLRPSL